MPSTFAPTCSLCGLRSATRSGHSWSCVSVTTTFSRTAAANQIATPVTPWTSSPAPAPYPGKRPGTQVGPCHQ
jgi:hypothetical protein